MRTFGLAAEAFGLLASPLRLHIALAPTKRGSGLSPFALRVGATPRAVSQHPARLGLAGFERVRNEGRYHFYQRSDPHSGWWPG